jgi:hypothetical protein
MRKRYEWLYSGFSLVCLDCFLWNAFILTGFLAEWFWLDGIYGYGFLS